MVESDPIFYLQKTLVILAVETVLLKFCKNIRATGGEKSRNINHGQNQSRQLHHERARIFPIIR